MSMLRDHLAEHPDLSPGELLVYGLQICNPRAFWDKAELCRDIDAWITENDFPTFESVFEWEKGVEFAIGRAAYETRTIRFEFPF